MKRTGDDYFDSKEFAELFTQYEDAVSSGQPVLLDADELTDIAEYYHMTGNDEQGEQAISLALSLSPDAPVPLAFKIQQALEQDDIETAKQLLARMSDKDNPSYFYSYADILLMQGKLEETDNYFRESFKTIPPEDYQDYVLDIVDLLTSYGYGEKATEWLARARRDDSDDFKELMARALFATGKYVESARLFNELIDHNPFSKRYWISLSNSQYMNKDYSDSVSSSEYAIAIDPNDPEALLSKANALFQLHNNEGALQYFERYLEQYPNDEAILFNKSTCLLNTNQADKAIETLEYAAKVAPPDSPMLSDIMLELAFCYNDKGEHERAFDRLERSGLEQSDQSHFNVVKGHLQLSSGLAEEAQASFKKAITLSKEPPHTFMRICVSFYDNHCVELAYKLFLKLFGMVEKDWTDGYAYMAQVCYDLMKASDFLYYLKKACQLNPAEAQTVLSHLFPDDLAPENYYDYIKDKPIL